MTLLTPVYTQLMYYYITLVNDVQQRLNPPLAVQTRCEWANELIPGLDRIVGNVKGLTLTVGQLLFVGALALLIILVATKFGGILIKVVVGVVVFALLLESGWLPISSPCVVPTTP